MATSQRYLVYLTRNFAKIDIEESVELAVKAGNQEAVEMVFGLQWQDVLECAESSGDAEPLLRETADFLRRKDFEAFRGFRSEALQPRKALSGAFYGSHYFGAHSINLSEVSGRFYDIRH